MYTHSATNQLDSLRASSYDECQAGGGILTNPLHCGPPLALDPHHLFRDPALRIIGCSSANNTRFLMSSTTALKNNLFSDSG